METNILRQNRLNQKKYEDGYSDYMESHNSTDTTNALFQMVNSLNSQIYDVELAVKEIIKLLKL